jgi:short-subunit dehydrogenase
MIPEKPVTLITGGTKGIGLGFARTFAARGHSLLLVARSEDDLKSASQEIRDAHGVEVHHVAADLAVAEGPDKVERFVRDKKLFVEYLVNNAGYGLGNTFERTDREKLLNMASLNMLALTDLSHRFLPAMIAAGRGGILNVSSLAGMTPGPYQAGYYASKAYVNSLTEALAHETRATGVKVSVLVCGPVETEFHERMGADTAYYIRLLGMHKPDDLAAEAADKFLAGKRVIIPGLLNRISAVAMRLTPHFVLVPCVAWLLKLRGGSARGHLPHFPAATGEVPNWENGVTYRPETIVRPETIDDIVRVVSDKENYPSPVRAVGVLHSPARCSADTGGTMLDMTGMSRIIEIGDDFVTAEAGAIFIDVAQELARHGLQFHINTEIGNVTLGAMACAATKDSSLIDSSLYGQVSSFVSGFKVVRPDGSVRQYTEDEDPEEMRLFRSSYGLLGVIVEVTFKVKPYTAVSVEHRTYSLAQFREAVPELVRQKYALMMYFFPFADRITVELRREVPDAEATRNFGWPLRNAFWRTLGPLFALGIKRISPNAGVEHALIRAFHRVMRRGLTWFVRGSHTRPEAQIIRYADDPGDIKYVFSMWSFDEAKYFDVLEAYFRFCNDYAEETGFRCDLPAVGYRILKDRNALLSYTHSGDAMSIDPASTGGEGWDDFLKAYNTFCSGNGGYPLFNQTKHLTPEQVQKAFGSRLSEFAEARSKHDPHDRLLSSYFSELLGKAGVSRIRRSAAE